ncbi:MmcQ/YjbR family DNA-binding protein [Variovorax sp. J31P207]|uniref:MmcQ/YjbR family DNA-binding protein n=1 Tax=Variovorax sp. J31P207 TaxID=3053510 RepID=UPI00257709E4|nr:MmcQ/YjbR family DNA-binding protein [Variovorax sp. J31P207]MDM0065239.1 MmcQ/YjbR family DNA-binding protein [Variovorax sp. J31P207]
MSVKTAVVKSVTARYRTRPDHLWARFPEYAVFRQKDSGKWYALFMTVQRKKLGLAGEGNVDVVNVKSRPEMVGSLRMKDGILPAYHMNKEHWLSVLLDATVPEELVLELISDSFELTSGA